MAFAYLSRDLTHAEECAPERPCGPRCDWQRLQGWLDAPLEGRLMRWEVEQEKRQQQRLRLLAAGEVPA